MPRRVDSDEEEDEAAPDDEQQPTPGPPGPPPGWRTNIEENIRNDVDGRNRQNLWKRAVDNCIRGKYSQADFH
eukprot:10174573-Karenia_brevis.AAC.1